MGPLDNQSVTDLAAVTAALGTRSGQTFTAPVRGAVAQRNAPSQARSASDSMARQSVSGPASLRSWGPRTFGFGEHIGGSLSGLHGGLGDVDPSQILDANDARAAGLDAASNTVQGADGTTYYLDAAGNPLAYTDSSGHTTTVQAAGGSTAGAGAAGGSLPSTSVMLMIGLGLLVLAEVS